MATPAQLATKVAEHLGFISAGQTITSNDSTIITEALTSLYLNLQRDHAVDWGPDEDIPDWAVLPMRDILSARVAQEFGRKRNVIEETLAFKELKRGLAIDDSGEPAKIQNF